jgi:RNA polymerase sigma factor (sigma-70 family)
MAVAAGLPADAAAISARPLPTGRLKRLLARGDARAFDQIFREHHQEIFRYCRALVGNRGDAEDALQATMAAALRALPGDDRAIEIRPWLFRVAHNESISIIRARREQPHPEPDAVSPGHAESPSEAIERSERLRLLVADLQSLPERQRSALVMRELSGLSYAEIATVLASAEGAARQTVHDARLALEIREEGREMSCKEVLREIDGGDRRRLRGRRIRANLDTCESCSGFERAMETRKADLEALCPPLPFAVGSGLLASLVGAGSAKAAGAAVGSGAAAGVGAAGGAGVAGVGAATAGAGLAGATALKGAAVLAAMTIAAGAADGAGVVDLPGPIGIGAETGSTGPGTGDGASSDGTPHGPEPRADGRPGSARAERARVRGIEASSKRGLNGKGPNGKGKEASQGRAGGNGAGRPGPPPSSNAGGNGGGGPGASAPGATKGGAVDKGTPAPVSPPAGPGPAPSPGGGGKSVEVP